MAHERIATRSMRDGWTLTTTAGVIAEAVTKKLEWHKQRHEVWQTKREKLKGQATEMLRLDDPEEAEKLATMAISNSYRGEMGVRLDPEWVEQLRFADRKMKEHADHIRTYGQWKRTLEMMSQERLLPLEHADRLYFGVNEPIGRVTEQEEAETV